MALHAYSRSDSLNPPSDSISLKGKARQGFAAMPNTNTYPPEFQSQLTQAMSNVKVVDVDCTNQTPGPYSLPPIIGYKNHDLTKIRAPAYTIGVKRPPPMQDLSTPGPIYETTGLNQYGKASSPKAKLRSRPPITSVYTDTLGPGPGYYSPEKHINAICPRAPSATIKGRKPLPMFEESPAPTFDPERVLGPRLPLRESAPTATVKGRKEDFSVYADAGPGPGSYNLGPVDLTMRSSPSAALGNKWPGSTVYNDVDTPGPDSYSPKAENFGPRAPKAFLGMKHSKCKAPFILQEDTYSLVDF